jgi:ABC-type nitrate/sulfonate/bicarbonate transport system permease component
MGATAPLPAIFLLLSLWSIAALLPGKLARLVPTPWSVAAELLRHGDYYLLHMGQTAVGAIIGYGLGNLIAIVAALPFLLAPAAERWIMPLLIALCCLPIMALAPIAGAILPNGITIAVVAAQGVFFVGLINLLAGLRSAPHEPLDLVHAFGGGWWAALWRVRIRYALPALFVGLEASARAAVLGAVIGEFVTADRGVGQALLTSLQSFDLARSWALGLCLTVMTVTGSAVVHIARRRLGTGEDWATDLPARRNESRRWWRSLADYGASIVLLLGLWWGGILLLGLDPFIAKTPLDVARCLLGATGCAGELRLDVVTTLSSTLVGYGIGLAIAIAIGMLAVLNRLIGSIAQSAAAITASVPLTATVPLVVLAIGRGTACVVAIATMVTLFPMLLSVVTGLRAAPKEALDVAATLGGGAIRTLLLLRLPFALPTILAMARLMVPLALVSALLAEWLAVGDGLGYRMLLAANQSQYTQLWAAVTLATGIALALYALVAAAETFILDRLA